MRPRSSQNSTVIWLKFYYDWTRIRSRSNWNLTAIESKYDHDWTKNSTTIKLNFSRVPATSADSVGQDIKFLLTTKYKKMEDALILNKVEVKIEKKLNFGSHFKKFSRESPQTSSVSVNRRGRKEIPPWFPQLPAEAASSSRWTSRRDLSRPLLILSRWRRCQPDACESHSHPQLPSPRSYPYFGIPFNAYLFATFR